MKTKIPIFTLITVLLFAGVAVAQNKVVVIPLLKSDPNLLPANICDGTTILGVAGIMACTPPPPTVTSPTGRIWMDRNLGASQVATSLTDAAAYGDLYQWGRLTDGHEKRTSAVTALNDFSDLDIPWHRYFIITNTLASDWRTPKNDQLWQGVTGTNNPCPAGFRIPNTGEWEAERDTWGTPDAAGAFGSPMHLPLPGARQVDSGAIFFDGVIGGYWVSEVNGDDAQYLQLDSNATMSSAPRAGGLSVRCIKN